MTKKAVVLAGGGTAGALFEVGALQALDALLPDAPLHTWDVMVGTSSGALIAALLAHGTRAAALPGLLGERGDLLTRLQPGRIALDWGLWQRMARRRAASGGGDMLSLFWGLGDSLPPGYFTPQGLADALHELLLAQGHEDRFASLDRALYVVATQLTSGLRHVFGPPDSAADATAEGSNVPVSLAVAASCAIPLIYTPVRIDGRAYIDGMPYGPAAVDVAIEAGAKLVVCINPLTALQDEETTAGNWGAMLVLHQAIRTAMQTALHQQIAALRSRHPDVRILLIEPVGLSPAALPWGPMHLGDEWTQEIELARADTAKGLLTQYDRLAAWLGEIDLRAERHWLDSLAAESV